MVLRVETSSNTFFTSFKHSPGRKQELRDHLSAKYPTGKALHRLLMPWRPEAKPTANCPPPTTSTKVGRTADWYNPPTTPKKAVAIKP